MRRYLLKRLANIHDMIIRNHTYTLNTYATNLFDKQLNHYNHPVEPTSAKTLFANIQQDSNSAVTLDDVNLSLITSYLALDPLDTNRIKADLYEASRSVKPSTTTDQLSELSLSNDSLQLNPRKVCDPNFINNLVLKESFYRDKIKDTYHGAELDAKLRELDGIVNEVADKLSQEFAQYIGNFFNGKLTNATFSDDIPEAYPNLTSFDVAKFKENVLQMISGQRQAFEAIKQNSPEKWQQVVQSGGSDISAFQQQLEAISSMTSSNSSVLESMNYNDMKATVGAIELIRREMGSSGDKVIMSSILGLAKTKSEMYVNTTPMSDSIKKSIQNAVDKNIQVKKTNINIEKILGEHFWANHGFGGKTARDYLKDHKSEILAKIQKDNTQPDDFYNMFADMRNCNPKNFLQTFMYNLSALKAELTKPTPEIPGVSAGEYISYEQKSRLADDINDQILRSWNDFINTLNVDEITRNHYLVPESSKNILDIRI